MKSLFKTIHPNPNRGFARHSGGFSLIELLTVMAIMAIMIAVITFNYRSTDSVTALEGMAHAVDGTPHQARVYATSVRAYKPTAQDPNFVSAYGVYFNSDTANSGGFIFFAKQPDDATDDPLTYGNNTFSGPTFSGCVESEGCIQRQTFKNGYIIKASGGICTGTAPGSCDSTGRQSLHVLYTKASSGPIITDNTSTTARDYAEIVLTSPDGTFSKTIRIWKTGATQVI